MKPEFENDFGQNPLLLGRFLKDPGAIAVLSLAGAFVGTAFAGLPLAGLVLAAGFNDILSVNKQRKEEKFEEVNEPEAIDASSQAFELPSLIGQQFQASPALRPSPSQPAPTNGVPRTKEELLKALRRECPALLSLVKSHPIRCVGFQRSGKTTLVKKLALLRMVLLPEHRVIASTPHYEPTNSYPTAFQIVGVSDGRRDYPAIRKEWNGLAQRVEEGKISSTTTIWDEFGLMDQVMEEETLTSVLTSCLRETMKFGEYPVFIVHGETAAFLPGSKGLVTVFLNGTVRVETMGEKTIGDDGLDTIKPTGKFRIQWLDGTRDEGKIPDWLTEELLIGMLPQPLSVVQVSPNPVLESLERQFNAEPFEPGYERLNHAVNKQFSGSSDSPEKRFTPLNLTSEQVKQMVQALKQTMNQTQIIEHLWSVKKGGTKGWETAREEYRQLTGE